MPDDDWRERARENRSDEWHIRATESALKDGPTEDAVYVTVRIPVEAYYRIEAVWTAERCGLDLRGSHTAVVEGLRKLLPRLPKGVVVTDVYGANDGRWSRDSIDAAVEHARKARPCPTRT